jgi:hypothetical protein
VAFIITFVIPRHEESQVEIQLLDPSLRLPINLICVSVAFIITFVIPRHEESQVEIQLLNPSLRLPKASLCLDDNFTNQLEINY